MAKLKDLMTPQELLELILSGTMKSELIKKHRTSDEELARMLLPLYRNGDLTKEEFNEFFKGVVLSRRRSAGQQSEDPAGASSQEDLPPSEIVRSLTAAQHEEPSVTKEQDEAPGRGLNVDAGGVDFSEQAEAEPSRDGLSEQAVPATEDASGALRSDSIEVDSTTSSSILDKIFHKLGSIESRLAAIEKKLGAD
jgi:hypothetical protein